MRLITLLPILCIVAIAQEGSAPPPSSARATVMYGSISSILTIHHDGELVVEIAKDGTIKYGENYNADTSAKLFWQTISRIHLADCAALENGQRIGASRLKAVHRSRAVRRRFQREHPCPSTGKRYGSCPGWIADHAVPLCAGGEDTPANLVWEEFRESLRKDEEERELCSAIRRGEIGAGGRGDLCQFAVIHKWPLLTKALCD